MKLTRRCVAPGATLVAILALAACARGADAVRDDSNIDSAPVLEAVEEQRIGDASSPELGFSRLYSADVDRDGNVYAFDAMAFEIRVFDRDGRLIRRIGRRGGGPGEFEGGPLFGVKGDTLWTYDMDAGRITLFDRGGQVLSTASSMGAQVRARTGTGSLMPMSMRPDGLLTTWFMRVSYPRPDDQPDTTAVPETLPRIVMDATGAVVDTIGVTPGPPPRMVPPEGFDQGRYQRLKVGDRSYSIPDPPAGLPEWLPLDDGHVVVDVPPPTTQAGKLYVTRLALDGDTVFQRALTYSAQPYTEEALDEIAGRQPFAVINGVAQPNDVDPAVRRAIREKMNFPPYRVPVYSSWIAKDQGVWLHWQGEPGAPERWVLLDPDGSLRGSLELPPKSRPLWSQGDVLWASVPDDDDVPWLVRYRITAARDRAD